MGGSNEEQGMEWGANWRISSGLVKETGWNDILIMIMWLVLNFEAHLISKGN
jgi:hypothetical protein